MMLYEIQKLCCSIFWYYEKIQMLYLGPKIWQISSVSLDTFIKHSINLIFPKSLLLHSYSFMLLKLWTYNYMSLVMFIMYDLHCMECVWYFDKTNYINCQLYYVLLFWVGFRFWKYPWEMNFYSFYKIFLAYLMIISSA